MVPGAPGDRDDDERAPDAELSGYVVLTRGAETAAPVLVPHGRPRPGGCEDDGAPAHGTPRRDDERRPDEGHGLPLPGEADRPRLRRASARAGAVFRVELRGPVANFGVVVTSRARGVHVEPRVVQAGDERRLTGYAALPLNLNPYLRTFGDPVLAAGAILPRRDATTSSSTAPPLRGPGGSPSASGSTTPRRPSRRCGRGARPGQPLAVTVADRGAESTRPRSSSGKEARAACAVREGVVRVPTNGLRPRPAALRLQVSDYQETRNMENVGRILPNTRILRHGVRRQALARTLVPGVPPRASGGLSRTSGAGRGRAARSRRTPPLPTGSASGSPSAARARGRGARRRRPGRSRAPLGSDDERDRQGEQHDPGPAHSRSVPRTNLSYSRVRGPVRTPPARVACRRVGLPALAHAEERTLVFTTPAISVEPYGVAQQPLVAQSPAVDGYVVGMEAEVVDAVGRVQGRDKVMLHHIVFAKFGVPTTPAAARRSASSPRARSGSRSGSRPATATRTRRPTAGACSTC